MPKTLTEVFSDPATQPAIIADCLLLLDGEVAEKGGLSGLAVRCSYAAAKGATPGFVEGIVESIITELAKALEPIVDEAQGRGIALDGHLAANRSRVADALLAITDARAARSASGAAKTTYGRLRGTAKHHVEAAVPRLATLIQKHAA